MRQKGQESGGSSEGKYVEVDREAVTAARRSALTTGDGGGNGDVAPARDDEESDDAAEDAAESEEDEVNEAGSKPEQSFRNQKNDADR